MNSAIAYYRGFAPGADAQVLDQAWRQGYDTNAIRHKVEGKEAMPNIPPKANRLEENCFSPFLYRVAQRFPPYRHAI